MPPYSLVIPLPAAIRSRLASFCFGLPQVRWVEEENFHLTLRYFGPLQDHIVTEIEERLKPLFFVSFPLVLNGISHNHSKGNRGVLRIGVEETPHLLSLKKEIDDILRDLQLPPEERPFHPHISLGKFEKLNPQKLGDYLAAYGEYRSDPFEVDRCLLVSSHQTPKHHFYKAVSEFPASLPATGED